MRIGIATDHGGFGLKEELVAQLRAAGHEVIDFGANMLSLTTTILILSPRSPGLWRWVRSNVAWRSAAAVWGHLYVPTRFPACARR